MLGTFADADDVVQDAWLRWHRADPETIGNPDAWLNTVVGRLALDRLRQRKRDEDRYVGPWLPSPLAEPCSDPAAIAELDASLTTAFLLMLETLTPHERAAFLLADVFGERFDDIAATLGRSPVACRQLASRARRKLRHAAPGDADRQQQRSTRIAERFTKALASGDQAAAVQCLSADCEFLSDGGEQQRAARRPIRDPARTVRLLTALWQRFAKVHTAQPARIGGCPGLLIRRRRDNSVYSTICFEIEEDHITRISTVVNPDKLHGIGRPRSSLI
jgi:RNA polymerase sigma-70 factor (ECF subfamily)